MAGVGGQGAGSDDDRAVGMWGLMATTRRSGVAIWPGGHGKSVVQRSAPLSAVSAFNRTDGGRAGRLG
ncbi:hypothetical protein E2562_035133 [Oryza meyeriana var. granulata]|uniref:Uncharacterized protein n=1 Tax=Oryza meyeriana var. granulata TaxID=110450 RepID=A0A6G1BNR3_9ORYZ|nr:hypothetical protein E2562_035133 [Oryza meyeriana var. granulata]